MTDTSELYWLMCDTPKIQEGYKFFFLPDIRWYLEHIEGAIQLNRNFDNQYYAVQEDITGNLFETDTRQASPEIALLKLYMHANHGKEWNGQEWVAI